MRHFRAIVTLAVLFTAPPVGADDAPYKPNVLFVAVDDLRPALACAGDPHPDDRVQSGALRYHVS